MNDTYDPRPAGGGQRAGSRGRARALARPRSIARTARMQLLPRASLVSHCAFEMVKTASPGLACFGLSHRDMTALNEVSRLKRYSNCSLGIGVRWYWLPCESRTKSRFSFSL